MPNALPRMIGPARPATPEDLVAALGPARVHHISPESLRESHHRIAELLAFGMRPAQVALECGFSAQRVASLMASPAFQELVAKKAEHLGAAFERAAEEYYNSLLRTRNKAGRMIEDRLDDAETKGETLPLRDLLAIRQDGDDRVGYSSRRVQANVNADFAKELEDRLARRKTIEAQPE